MIMFFALCICFLESVINQKICFFSDLEEIDYLNKTKNQLKYLDDLKNKFKINHASYTIDKKLKLNSLMGPFKERIFRNTDLEDYGKDLENITKIKEIWSDFWRIYNNVRKTI